MRPGVALDAEAIDADVEHLGQLGTELGVARDLLLLREVRVGLQRAGEVGDPVLLGDAVDGLLLHGRLTLEGDPVDVGLLDLVEQLQAGLPQALVADLGAVEMGDVVDLGKTGKEGAEHVLPPWLRRCAQKIPPPPTIVNPSS